MSIFLSCWKLSNELYSFCGVRSNGLLLVEGEFISGLLEDLQGYITYFTMCNINLKLFEKAWKQQMYVIGTCIKYSSYRWQCYITSTNWIIWGFRLLVLYTKPVTFINPSGSQYSETRDVRPHKNVVLYDRWPSTGGIIVYKSRVMLLLKWSVIKGWCAIAGFTVLPHHVLR